MEFKKIKLKNGQICEFSTPTLADAQPFCDYVNMVRQETPYLSSGAMDKPTTFQKEYDWIKAKSESNTDFIVVAKIKNKIVGVCNYSIVSTKMRIKHRCMMGITVAKQFWHLGIATEMLNLAIASAKKKGFEQMELEVDSTNQSAISLYKKFNFVETGKIINAIKYENGDYADLILMQKMLTKN